jgi:hypothetical protein
MLTSAQSNLINNSKYTHNYEAEALASFEATGNDLMDELQARFENSLPKYDNVVDLGGLVVYFKSSTLVAFYDYERFVGAVY